jgi:PadR family transcriptional regulator PadR
MRGASVQDWTAQVRKGLIELWLMGHLAQGQSYGYQLGQLMFEDGGQGVRWGTIYRVLARLRRAGWVTVHKGDSPLGPHRSYYRLSPAGERRLKQMTLSWRSLARATEKALKASG